MLDQIATITKIFDVWEDQPWVNEGANLRVSMVCFGGMSQTPFFNGEEVTKIYSDLTAQKVGTGSVDLTTIMQLTENINSTYFGFCLAGTFKVPASLAASWLRQPNPHLRSNGDVLKPIYNGTDITSPWCGKWVIDFGARMSESEAAMYEKPFEFVKRYVLPVREKNKRFSRAKYWWRHGEARPGLREKIANLPRYIATVETAKHRFFVFFPTTVAPEHSLIVIPRADDVSFGLLESRFHFVWTMRVGSPYGNHPTARRYNAARTFDPFPFPEELTPADTCHQITETVEDGLVIPAGTSINAVRASGDSTRVCATRIARAAKRLNDLREAWLNPPEWTQRVPEVIPLGMTTSPYPDRILPKSGHEKDLAERTLTKLYNARPAWLDAAHKELDLAVAAAYGWADYAADTPDEEILKRLLALNLARAAAEKT